MDPKRLQYLKEKVSQLPLKPGCYIFSNRAGEVIYVGKAKKLKNRVSSYFVQSRDHTTKVKAMVAQIHDLRHIVVDSETDALLLENSLIKTYKPRYNILLKDDKSYPWITIRNEAFPRIQSTRQMARDGSQYFGPYGSVQAQRAILDFIREMLPLRTCSLDLSEEKIARGKYSTCLQWHLGNCKAPCTGNISQQEYARYTDLAAGVLKGKLSPVKSYLEQEMTKAAQELKFELAQQFKARLEALEEYQGKSVIVSASIVNTDVFSLLKDEQNAYINFVRLREGSITAVQTITLTPGIEATDEDMLTLGIQHFSQLLDEPVLGDVLVPFMPHTELFEGIRFFIPQRGDKAKLLDFSLRSAKVFRAEQMRNQEIHNPNRRTDRLMAEMQRELHLKREPRHIECFDNSNFQGTYPVASCVVFRDGKPSKKEYRHFNVKSVVGPDDFASMREIVYRRYRRLMDEGKELPDLIIVDGGKGQLSSAYSVLQQLGIEERVPIVGLAKRLEEVYYPNDPEPFYLSRTGEPLKVVCHLRDEAHRFGITFHRHKRNVGLLQSELEQIEGIGEKSRTALLKKFRSLAKIKEASLEALSEVIGPSRAKILWETYHGASV